MKFKLNQNIIKIVLIRFNSIQTPFEKTNIIESQHRAKY